MTEQSQKSASASPRGLERLLYPRFYRLFIDPEVGIVRMAALTALVRISLRRLFVIMLLFGLLQGYVMIFCTTPSSLVDPSGRPQYLEIQLPIAQRIIDTFLPSYHFEAYSLHFSQYLTFSKWIGLVWIAFLLPHILCLLVAYLVYKKASALATKELKAIEDRQNECGKIDWGRKDISHAEISRHYNQFDSNMRSDHEWLTPSMHYKVLDLPETSPDKLFTLKYLIWYLISRNVITKCRWLPNTEEKLDLKLLLMHNRGLHHLRMQTRERLDGLRGFGDFTAWIDFEISIQEKSLVLGYSIGHVVVSSTELMCQMERMISNYSAVGLRGAWLAGRLARRGLGEREDYVLGRLTLNSLKDFKTDPLWFEKPRSLGCDSIYLLNNLRLHNLRVEGVYYEKYRRRSATAEFAIHAGVASALDEFACSWKKYLEDAGATNLENGNPEIYREASMRRFEESVEWTHLL